MNKIKRSIVAAAIALICGSAFADTMSQLPAVGAFDGFYTTLGFGMGNASYKYSTGDEAFIFGSQNYLGELAAGYSKAFSSGFNIAGNIFGTLNGNYNNTTKIDSVSVALEEKNSFGVALEPGYYLNARTLVYGKFSYVRGSFKTSVEEPELSLSTNNNGIGVGIGAKYLLSQNWFAGLEVQQIYFAQSAANNGVNFTPNQTMAVVNVGYIFK